MNSITQYHYHKWHTTKTLKIKEFHLSIDCLIDSGADVNYIRQGLIPTKYFEKIKSYTIGTVNGKNIIVNYKIQNPHVCNNGKCIQTSFAIAKFLTNDVILGTPFLLKIQPFSVDPKEIHAKLMISQ